jgi:renalase
VRTVVVGAGLAGLMAARAVTARGGEAVVLDKGRSPGGRLATRRIGEATLDHGAQFFTVRTDTFAAHVQDWRDEGLVRVWSHGFALDDGHPRYVGVGGMNTIAKHLARGLDVRCNTMAFAIHRATTGWRVDIDDGTSVTADALVVTCPVPQALSLVITAGVALPDALRTLDYDRTIALLAVIDGPSAVPAPGGVQPADGTFAFVGDNLAKGISGYPAVTFHATSGWSREQWDADRDAVHAALLEAARPWLGQARVVESHVKRWRFATPRAEWPDACWRSPDGQPLVLAGDAFAGPRVEGAALSGLAAAEVLAG